MKKEIIRPLLVALLLIAFIYESQAQFVKAYARNTQNQYGDCIVKKSSTPDRYLVGGMDHTLALIMEVDENGNKIWDWRFKVEPTSGYQDRIVEMIIDSDGYLVGVGQSKKNGNKNFFAFRLDISSASATTAPTILWIKKSYEGATVTSTSKMNGQNIHELPEGDFLITHGYNKRSCIVKLERGNGNIIPESRICYETSPTTSNYDDFNSTELRDDYLYVAGRSYIGSSSSGRPAIWKIDVSPNNYGNVDHTEYYLEDKNTSIYRGLYGRSLNIGPSGDDMSFLGYGNWDHVNNIDDEEVILIKQSMTNWGENAYWVITFNPSSNEYVNQPRHVEMPDGYIIMATNVDASKFYLVRIKETDPIGTSYPGYDYYIDWAKEYIGTSTNIAGSTADKNMIVDGQYVYIVRSSTDHSNNGQNVLVVKCHINNGEFGDDSNEISCSVDIEPEIENRDNFSDAFTTNVSYPSPPHLLVTTTMDTTNLDEDFLCGPAPACDYDVTIQSTPMSNCTYQFGANFTGTAGGPFSYEWDFGDGNTSTESNPTHTYATTGPLYVNLTVYGFSDDGTTKTCCKEEAEALTVFPENCDPCLNEAGFEAELINCEVYKLTAIGNSSYTAVFWDFADGTIGSGQSTVHHFPAPGTYDVTVTGMYYDGETCCIDDYNMDVTVEDCCDDEIVINGRPAGHSTNTLSTQNDTPAEESVMEKVIHTYPNPINGMLNITHPTDIHTIDVLDVRGRKISSEKVQNSEQSEYDMQSLDSGVYFLILSGNERHVERVVKN